MLAKQGYDTILNWHDEKDDESIFETGQNNESIMPFTVNLINYTGNLS